VINVAYAGQSLRSFSRRVGKVAASVRPRLALIYPSPASYFEDPTSDTDAVDWVKEQPGFESHLRTKIFDLLATMPEWIEMRRDQLHIWKETRHTGTIQRVPELNVVRFHNDLSRLLDQLQENHIQPVLITHATRFGRRVLAEDRPILIAWRRFAPRLEESAFLDIENRLNNVIRNEASARGLLLIDAADNLSGRANFADYAHFTDRGASAMAHLIANRLLTENDSPTSSAPNVAALGRSRNSVLQ
jgi:hypothetical protein